MNKHTEVENYRQLGEEGVKRLIFSKNVICIQDAGMKLRKIVAAQWFWCTTTSTQLLLEANEEQNSQEWLHKCDPL